MKSEKSVGIKREEKKKRLKLSKAKKERNRRGSGGGRWMEEWSLIFVMSVELSWVKLSWVACFSVVDGGEGESMLPAGEGGGCGPLTSGPLRLMHKQIRGQLSFVWSAVKNYSSSRAERTEQTNNPRPSITFAFAFAFAFTRHGK